MNLLQYVNPLQGTASTYEYSNGNTLPLVARPFGMAAWSAQTQEAGGGWFFHPAHRRFEGIRLTHQPSPWIGDYGHLTLLPQTGPLTTGAPQRSSSFRPEDMQVKPDYFSIRLRRYETLLELTPTERCASIRTTYGEEASARMILAPFAGESSFHIDPAAGRLTGYTRANSGGVPGNFAMYFVMEWDCDTDAANCGLFYPQDEPSSMTASLSGTAEQLGAYIAIRPPGSGRVNWRIGTSFISMELAQVNLDREIGASSFDEVREEATQAWNGILNRIQAEDPDEERVRTFYTCMYRVCLFPRMWHEFTAGEQMVHYSPYNGKVETGPMYCDNGFWDTFRTSYPLFSLLFPSRLGEILQGYVNAYREGGWMPKWSSPGERSMMPGTLIDAVFADAYVKEIREFDAETAYEGLLKHALQAASDPHLGRKGFAAYEQYGFLPADQFHESVSNTLDYVYGDFCIAQFAKALGKEEEHQLLISRAAHYTKLLDPSTGFMRGKQADGSWTEPFDPEEWGGDYCEGSAWQCSWAVPHDVLGLAEAMGGKEVLLQRLDELMTAEPVFRVGSYGFEIHEMSEMAAVDFGQCAISNQPSFHIPYLFTALGAPERTEYWTSRLARELFSSGVEGLPGDEDNGSLCAWYIFTSLGMYPLCPGVPEYVTGSPLYQRITIQLENGKQIIIEAEGDSEAGNRAEACYVSSVCLNGQPHRSLFFTHQELMAGALIQYTMSDSPCSAAAEHQYLPYSMSVPRQQVPLS